MCKVNNIGSNRESTATDGAPEGPRRETSCSSESMADQKRGNEGNLCHEGSASNDRGLKWTSNKNGCNDNDKKGHNSNQDDGTGSCAGTTEGGDLSSRSSPNEEIAKEETKWVNLSKIMVVVVIIVLALLLGLAVHSFLQKQEEKEYQSRFKAIADEIISTTHIRSKAIFSNLESVGVALTAQARAMDAKWPFVMFPDFQVQGMISNQVTGANTLTIHPLVQDKDREEWELFSVSNQQWIAEGHNYDEHVHPRLYTRDFYNDVTVMDRDETPRWNTTGIIPTIWTTVVGGAGIPVAQGASKTYSPFWQRSPAADFISFANQDLQSMPIFQRVIQGMLETDHPVMTEVTDATYLRDSYDQRFPPEEKDTPHIYLLSPIYDNFFLNRTAVGFLSAFFRFDNFFVNVLPEAEQGIIVVLDGSCGQTYSYMINGHKAIYMGTGNLADGRYEHMRRDFDIAPFALLEDTHDRTYCQYKARIYPSSEWEDKFFSSEPIYYALGVVSCFVITTLVFLIYDVLVQIRQRKVMDSAAKTHAIVSSLFPSNFRDRLMEEMQAKDAARPNRNRRSWTAPQSLDASTKKCATSEAIFGSKPIAELFPSTTIMFADLVGFTAWSASREPCQVFTLLETIYHTFDSIARKLRVFKVETVGDCYVAVCGLPVPCDDHAVTMARFAHGCHLKMNQLVLDLASILGPETAQLAMRTGLHSGPVTAGVLRGDKGRFQLSVCGVGIGNGLALLSSKILPHL